ncbi:MAG: Ig-like domain-containing protein, partial [Hyphomicrobiales bacterium]
MTGDPYYYPEDAEDWDEDEYDDAYDDYEYDEYDDGYYADSPARQPMFYVFLAMAALIGVAAVVLLFSLVGGGDDNNDPAGSAEFRVSLDSPRNGDRVDIGKAVQVTVQATANEAIDKFELFVDGKSVDQVQATPPASGSAYIGVLNTTFTKKGEHELYVRVYGVSGASKDTDKV